jgi:RNA polymerase sigma factor (sigma-70 family)
MYATADPGVVDASHLDALSDTELLYRYRFGEDVALDALIRRYSEGLYRFCCHLTGNREDAEDICQETIARAIGRVDTLQSGASFKSWLYSIARNLAMDSFRGRKRVCAMPEDEDGPVMLYEDSPHDRVEISEEHQTVAEALARLAKSHQQVLMMREVQGMSYANIAAKLDVSQSAVETLLFRARRRLREEYGKRVAIPAVVFSGGLRKLLSRLSLPASGGAPIAAKLAAGGLLLGVTASVAVPRVLPSAVERHARPGVAPVSHTVSRHTTTMSIPSVPAGTRAARGAPAGRRPLLAPSVQPGAVHTAAEAISPPPATAIAAVALVGRQVAEGTSLPGFWSAVAINLQPTTGSSGAGTSAAGSAPGSTGSSDPISAQVAAVTQAGASHAPTVGQGSGTQGASESAGSPPASGVRGTGWGSAASTGSHPSSSTSGSSSHPQSGSSSGGSQNPITQVTNTVGQGGGQATSTAGQATTTPANGSSGSATAPAQSAANQAGNTASQVTNQASNTVTQVGNTTTNVTNQAGNTASQVTGQAGSTTNNAGGQVKKTAGQAGGQASSTTGQATNTVHNTTGQASGQAKKTTGQAQNTTGQAGGAAQQAGGQDSNTASSTTQAAGQTAGQVKNAAGGVSAPVPAPTTPPLP